MEEKSHIKIFDTFSAMNKGKGVEQTRGEDLKTDNREAQHTNNSYAGKS